MKSKSIILFVLASFLLGACAAQLPESTATSTAISTSTLTETPQPTASFTPTPDPNFLAWQEKLGNNFEAQPDGTVWDKTTNLQLPGINWKKNIWTYEFDGNPNFTVPLSPKQIYIRTDTEGKPTGEISLKHTGWIWNGKEYKRKMYEEEELYSVEEIQAILINPKYVLMSRNSATKENFYTLLDKFRRRGKALPKFELRNGKKVTITRYGWGDNIIPIPNKNGGYEVVETTIFIISRFNGTEYCVVSYWGADGKADYRIIDNGDIQDTTKELKHPSAWSQYYDDPAHSVKF